MPIYNFKRQFADAVRNGTKKQTIRARGKRKPPEPGQIAHCYTDLRTQQVSVLGKYKIERVTPISISAAQRIVQVPANGAWRELGDEELEPLAQADGFVNADAFFDFFRAEHGSTFSGYLIEWGGE